MAAVFTTISRDMGLSISMDSIVSGCFAPWNTAAFKVRFLLTWLDERPGSLAEEAAARSVASSNESSALP